MSDIPDPPGGTQSVENINAQSDAISEMNRNMSVGLERLIEQRKIELDRVKISQDMVAQRKIELEMADALGKKVQDAAKGLLEAKGFSEDLAKSFGKQVEEFGKLQPQRAQAIEDLKNLYIEQVKISQDASRSEAERKQAADQALQAYQDINREIETSAAELDDAARHAGQASNNIRGMADFMGLTAHYSENASGKIFDMLVDTTQSADKMKNMALSVLEMVSPLNIMTMLMDKFIQTAINIDQTAKGFQQATGFAGDFSSMMIRTAESTALVGASLADQASALSALSANVGGFSGKVDSLNEDLMETMVVLNKVGASFEGQAKMIDLFANSLDKTGNEAANMLTRLSTMGTGIGISVSKMMGFLDQGSSILVEFGSTGERVFTEMAALAHATGLSISELIGIAEQFDTFDKAAESAAKLNAVLGTGISTVRMINAEHGQRVNLLRQEIQNTVGNFNNLDRYTKKLVANSMGVKSVDAAQRLLNMSTEEFTKYESGMAAMAKTQEDLKNLAMDFVPIMQQVTVALEEAFRDPEMIETVTSALEGLVAAAKFAAQVIGFIADNFKMSLAIYAAVKLSYLAMTGVLSGFVLNLKALVVSQKAADLAGKTMTPGVTKLGAALGSAGLAATKGALGFAAIGFAVGAIGYGVSLALPPIIELFTLVFDNFDKLAIVAAGWAAIGSSFTVLGLVALASLIPVGALFKMTTGWVALMKGLNISKLAVDLARIGDAYAKIGTQGDIMIASTEGDKTSIFAGSSDVFNKIAASPNINVKVDMPDLSLAKVEVTLNIDGTLLDQRVLEIVEQRLGSVIQ